MITELPAQAIDYFKADIPRWCAEGRLWQPRALLWAFMVYIAVQHFRFPFYESIFGGLNLGIHEGGHLLFSSMGRFLHVAGGTICQLAAPLIALGMFLKQRDYFGVTVAFGWLGTNCFNSGTYMADAEKMALPLVTVGDSGGIVMHDWRYLFTQLGLLSHCEMIGGLMNLCGHLCMLACILGGAGIIFMIAQAGSKPPPVKV